jgi:hypothetical protein
MSDPDDRQDFSARRGCVWAPALILALAVLIATLALVAQHRLPFHLGSPTTPSFVPTQQPRWPGCQNASAQENYQRRRAEDDPESGLRQVAPRRHSRELAGDEFEIAFDQGEVGGFKPARAGIVVS